MGDGNFNWWMAIGHDPEAYTGPYDSRDQAIAQAKSEDGDRDGFTIAEADKSIANGNPFDADQILERFEEVNEECWGEDGMEVHPTNAQATELEGILFEAFTMWMDRHKLTPRPFRFDTMRNEEYFPPLDSPSNNGGTR